MNVLNTTVSIFPNYYTSTNPEQVKLLSFLKSAKYRKEVETIRATEDKAERDRLKATLPAITPSGIFTERKEAALVQHSGLIQIDIDWKENSHIANFFELKEQLCKLPQIAYLALSVSGKGFWGLIPLAYPERHKEHFQALLKDFANWGLSLDEKPGNVASLRGYSWDSKAYFNPQAEPYRKLARNTAKPSYTSPARTRARTRGTSTSPGPGSWTEQQKVEACLEQLEAGRIDIAPSYSEWFALASSLASHFSEAGRDYFHRASQFYPGYQQQGTDRQYSACLKSKGKGYTIATFYKLCREAGITYQETLKNPPRLAHGATRASSKAQEAPAIPEHKSEAEQPTRDTHTGHAHTGQTRDTGREKHGPGLPEGFQATGAGLEVDGLPWAWLNEEEQEEARERLAGKELEAMKALNPNVSALIERFGLVEEKSLGKLSQAE